MKTKEPKHLYTRKQALELIEWIASNAYQYTASEDTPENKALNEIYTVAHTMSSCRHGDWEKEVKATIDKFKKDKIL